MADNLDNKQKIAAAGAGSAQGATGDGGAAGADGGDGKEMKKIERKPMLAVLAVLVGIALMAICFTVIEINLSLGLQKTNTSERLKDAETRLESAATTAQANRDTYDKVYQAKADVVAYMANYDNDYKETDEWMDKLAKQLKVTNVMILDNKGNVICKAFAEAVDYKSHEYDGLRAVFDKNVEYEAFRNADRSRRLFATYITNNREVVISHDPSELDILQDATTSYDAVLSKISVGLNGFTMAISADDNSILYHPDSELEGLDAFDAGLTQAQLADGAIGWVNLFGTKYYAGAHTIPSQNLVVLCLVPYQDMLKSNIMIIVGTVIAFAVIFITVTVFVYFCIRESMLKAIQTEDERRFYQHKVLRRKVITSVIIGIVIFFAASFYLQTLFALSLRSASSKNTAVSVVAGVKANNDEIEELRSEFNRRYLNKASTAADIIQRNPQLKNKEDLRRLSDAIDVEFIMLFDRAGSEIVSDSDYVDFMISSDPESQSYEFNKLLQGVPSLVQEAMPDDISGTLHQYAGVLMKDNFGEPDGFLQISVIPTDLSNALAATELGHVLDNVKAGSGSFVFAVNKETKNIAYYPDDKVIGKTADSYGITDDKLKDGFSDYININGNNFFCYCAEGITNYLYIAVPQSKLMASRVPASLLAAVLGLIIMVIVEGGLLLLTDKLYQYALKSHDYEVLGTQGTTITVNGKQGRAAADRWSGKHIPWAEQGPGEKTRTVLAMMMFVCALFISVCYLFRTSLFASDSIINYVTSNQWEKGHNVFALTACLMLICVGLVCVGIVEELLTMMSKIVSPRGETICRLLKNSVKYLTVVILLYYCMSLLGADSTTLWTSAGIMSVVIGLGAKSIISDILSGLFIIFEGDFQVGDIVMVGDWRGTVEEIGVRTTKIVDPGKNVKIICNSNLVSGVINMTRQSSVCVCDVGIDYSESLERVETILMRELPLIKEKLPSIIDGPFYKGVLSLGDSSVNIRIIAQCAEGDRAQLGRDLNREMKILFDKYDVNIPFPQVVINQPKEYQKATAYEKRKAAEFNEEQKELSKNMIKDQNSSEDNEGEDNGDSGEKEI